MAATPPPAPSGKASPVAVLMAPISARSSPGKAAACTIEPGRVSSSTTPSPPRTFPWLPGFQAAPSGDSGSTMHAAPLRVVEMMADDLDRPEAVAQRVRDEGARAVPCLAALDHGERDVAAECGRIAGGGDVADRAVRVLLVDLIDDMRATGEGPVVERDQPDQRWP